MMETDFSLNSVRDGVQNCILTPSTMLLSNEGFELLKETTEAVRAAISKVNAFKLYLKDQIKPSHASISQEGNESATIDELRFNVTPQNPLLNMVDTKLQVFFTIPDNKITESEVREAVEKEGFEDFIITIKNRLSHSFGFIKFCTEDAVNRAIDMNQKISVNNLLVKIRPHRSCKNNSAASVTNNEDANNVSQTIDESLLINVSSGYQHHRSLSNYLKPVEQNDTSLNVELEKSIVHPSEPETPIVNKAHFIDLINENVNKDTPVIASNVSVLTETEMEWKQNDHFEKRVYPEGYHSAEKNKFSHRNPEKNSISTKNLPRYEFKKHHNFQKYSMHSKNKSQESMNQNRYNSRSRSNNRKN